MTGRVGHGESHMLLRQSQLGWGPHVVQGFIGKLLTTGSDSGLPCEPPSPMWFLASVTPFRSCAATNGPTCMLFELLTKATMHFLCPLVRIPSQRTLLTSVPFVHKSCSSWVTVEQINPAVIWRGQRVLVFKFLELQTLNIKYIISEGFIHG